MQCDTTAQIDGVTFKCTEPATVPRSSTADVPGLGPVTTTNHYCATHAQDAATYGVEAFSVTARVVTRG